MKKLIFKIFILIFILLLIALILIFGLGYIKYKSATKNLSIHDAVLDIQNDNNYTKIEDISDDFKKAIIAVEDHRFYEHRGFDIISILHSIYVDFINKSLDYGGSTITQQVARNIYFNQDKSVIRKTAEFFVANELENTYSKEEILELYLNIIYFGNGYYGIHNASYGYFKKSPKDLNLYEASYLAGLPNAPSVYSQDSKLAEQRRLQVIQAMEKYN